MSPALKIVYISALQRMALSWRRQKSCSGLMQRSTASTPQRIMIDDGCRRGFRLQPAARTFRVLAPRAAQLGNFYLTAPALKWGSRSAVALPATKILAAQRAGLKRKLLFTSSMGRGQLILLPL